MKLALYDNPDSPNCRKVRLMLAALALPYETRPVELSNGETRRPAFLAVNPSGQIPVLVHDGFVLPESDAILGYLAECFAPEWLGHDARARAIVRRFMGWLSGGTTRRIASIGYQRVIGPIRGQPTDEATVSAQLAAWRRDATVLERWLREQGCIVPTPSIADLALGAWLEVAERVGMLDDVPAIARWLARLQALDYWRLAGGYRLL